MILILIPYLILTKLKTNFECGRVFFSLCCSLNNKESFAYNIYGYDYSYKELLSQSKLTTLSERRSDLCSKFFDKIMSDPQNNMYKLLPFNEDSHSYDLRRKGRIYPPKCATNRQQKTFIVSASQEFNTNLKTI